MKSDKHYIEEVSIMEKNLTEYLSNIRSELTKNSWHYSQDRAAEIVLNHIDYLQNAYNHSEPAWEATLEIGFDVYENGN